MSTDVFLLHAWFDIQEHCLGQGLTREEDKSDQPYWTRVYRRLTPLITILGEYLFVFFYYQFSRPYSRSSYKIDDYVLFCQSALQL